MLHCISSHQPILVNQTLPFCSAGCIVLPALVSRSHTLHKEGRVWSNAYACVVLFPRNCGEHEYANVVAVVQPQCVHANHSRAHLSHSCAVTVGIYVVDAVRKAGALLEEKSKVLYALIEGESVLACSLAWACSVWQIEVAIRGWWQVNTGSGCGVPLSRWKIQELFFGS